MAAKVSGIDKPPYPSYSSFKRYINKLSEGTVPSQIDRSVFGNQSGTYISSMISAFRWLGLTNEEGVPQQVLYDLVEADEKGYQEILRERLLESYPCMRDGSLDLKTGTTNQIASIFRAYKISGSTLTKAIAFFLGAARDAGFEIGPHMKTPQPPRSSSNGRKEKKKSFNVEQSEKVVSVELASENNTDVNSEMERIVVPLRGMPDGVIFFPSNLTVEEAKKVVKMAVFILHNFYGIDDE